MTITPEASDDDADAIGPYPIVFREFLYANLDRARSLFAQRLGGVPEQSRSTDSTFKHFSLGVARYLGTGTENKIESYEERSLLAALFPALEELLEAEQWLTDISDIIASSSADYSELSSVVQPGSIVRMTCTGQLFDPQYIAQVLGGTSAAARGIHGIGAASNASSGSPVGGKAKPSKQGGDRGGRSAPSDSGQLEDLIENFSPDALGGIGPEMFRAFIRIARGMFSPGLHMQLNSSGRAGWTAIARLERGRRYLDAEPEVLFSRYGITPQEWTVVGTIGHFAVKPPQGSTTPKFPDFTIDGRISRAKFVEGLNTFLSMIAAQGLSDAPAYPGFSIVPLAVYRLIPPAVSNGQR